MEQTKWLLRLLRAPAVWAWLICSSVVLCFVYAICQRTDGTFVFPLDDTYIHLALARTLAQHHVWGIGAWEFGSASSSPVWTVLLAATDVLFGVHTLTPIVLNIFFSLGLLWAIDYGVTLVLPKVGFVGRFSLLLVIVLAAPLPNLVLIGMEHVLQALTIMLLVLLAIRELVRTDTETRSAATVLLLMGCSALAAGVRYEAVFAVFPIAGLFLLRRRYWVAFLLVISSACVPAAFGLYSHLASGFWLPFSVMAKIMQNSTPVTLRHRLLVFLGGQGSVPLVEPLLLLWALRMRARGFWNPVQLLLLLALCITGGHLLFAPIGWLMRYETYLLCLGLFALGAALIDTRWPQWRGTGLATAGAQQGLAVCTILALLLLARTCSARTWMGLAYPVPAAVDRYDQHIQMGRFVASGYDHDTVVANDIGAIAYLSHARILDMLGLGSSEPLLPSRKGQRFSAEDMRGWALAKGATIAILQSDWPEVKRDTPPEWIPVQKWEMQRRPSSFTTEVSFYALNRSQVQRLCQNLADFPRPLADSIVYNACP